MSATGEGRAMAATIGRVERYVGGAAYLGLYVALDRISLIDPIGSVGITPWNPPAGLSFALLLRYGVRFAPLAFLAAVLADVLQHGLSAAPFATAASASAIVLVYGAAAVLLRRRFGIADGLRGHRDLQALLVVALVASAAVALAVVGIFVLAELLRAGDVPAAVQRFWIGDLIGIAVLTPFLLLLADPQRAADWRRIGTAAYGWGCAAIALGLGIVFGWERTDHFELSYVLFLPLLWIALRDGLTGAAWGVVVTQLGLILSIWLKGYGAEVVTQFQALMLAVAATGLFLGAVVDERRRAEAALRARDAELAQAARLTATGAMAAALAHELNQPLTAMIGFVRACEGVLRAPAGGGEAARRMALDLIDDAARQALRAGDIVRAARELVGRGDTRRMRVPIAPLFDTAVEQLRVDLDRHGVHLDARTDGAPAALADPIQIEQVLHNLLRNAVTAMAGTALAGRVITLSAAPCVGEAGMLEIAVRDTGPGFPPMTLDRLFRPFATGGGAGMGLGLAICRSIVEAHGGRIWATAPRDGGAEIRFTLPADREGSS